MTIHDLGLQPQFWILPIVFAAAVIFTAAVILLGVFLGDGADGVAAPVGGIFGGIAVLAVGIAWLCVGVPFNPTYQHYYEVSGRIESVTNGFADSSGDITNRVYVVQLSDDKRPYQLQDARVTQLKGQKVSLTCAVAWIDYGNSADQWDCNIRTADFTTEGH